MMICTLSYSDEGREVVFNIADISFSSPSEDCLTVLASVWLYIDDSFGF